MADRSALTFITSNPATAAFEHGQKVAQQREAADLAIQGQQLQNTENFAAAPSRLKRVNADASLATTNANVAQETAPYKVQTAASGARSAGANADVAVGTVGSRIASSGAAARLAGANADVGVRTVDSRVAASDAAARAAGANADVAVGTVEPRIQSAEAGARTAGATADVSENTVEPRIESAVAGSRLATTNADVGERTADARVTSAQAGARSAGANAVKAEMDGFYKSLELLNAGDVASAQEVARRYGTEIPQAVIENADMRREVTDAANYAKTYYPNRPKDQQAYMQGFLKTRMERLQTGQAQPDPTAVYNVPNAPAPPELSTQQNQHAPADIQTAQWLVTNGVAKTPEEAWGLVRQSRANPQTIYASVFNNALRSNFGNETKARATADAFMKVLGTMPSAAPQAPAAAPAAPAPAATPPVGQPSAAEQPPGAGTRESPYQGSTQSQVDWFKTKAPAGSVIYINGKPYTK